MKKSLQYLLRYFPVICMIIVLTAVKAYSQNAAQDTIAQASTTAQRNTGQQEDIGRFMGFDPLLERYLSLPYDTLMNVNWSSAFLDIGFIIAIFLPFILLLGRKSDTLTRILFMFLLGAGLIFSVSSSFVQRFRTDHPTAINNLQNELNTSKDSISLQHIDHLIKLPMMRLAGAAQQYISPYTGDRDKITYPILFGGFFLFLILAMRRFRSEDMITIALLVFWLYYSFLWLVLSGGIPWYGILLYPLAILLVVYALAGKPVAGSGLKKLPVYTLYGAAVFSLILFFPLRFTGFSPQPDIRGKLPHYPELINYQIGEYTASEAIEKLYPQVQKAMSVVNRDQTTLVYGIGTFMPFFVEKSDQRIFPDPYLDFFMRLSEEYPDRNELARALHAYGYRYIILDLKLPTIDLTADKTLTKKFEWFLTFVYQNQHIELVAADQLVKLERDGSEIFAIGLYEPHTIIRRGRFAVYRLF